MWIYNKIRGKSTNTDRFSKIYVHDSYFDCMGKTIASYDLYADSLLLESFSSSNDAKKELSKIMEAIAENKSVYILD